MTRKEARHLLAQLGVTPAGNPVDFLMDHCDRQGLIVALDNTTGEWHILCGGDVLARCE